MQECIVVEQGVIDAASAKLRNNKQALAYAITMCDAFETQYQHAKASRSRELELLGKLKAFVRERAEVFGNYGTERSNVFDDYKSEYEKKQFVQVDQFLEKRRLKIQKNPSFVQSKLDELKNFWVKDY